MLGSQFSAPPQLARELAALARETESRIAFLEQRDVPQVRLVSGNTQARFGEWLQVDATQADVTIELPQPRMGVNCYPILISRAAGRYNVLIVPLGAQIDGAARIVHNSPGVRAIYCDRANYFTAATSEGFGGSLAMRSHLAAVRVGRWNPVGNATTAVIVDGITASATGTATASNVATTNALTIQRRLGYVSAAAAGSSAGLRGNALQYCRGSAARQGGFLFVGRFGCSDPAPVANARCFVGLHGTAAVIGNVNPSTLTNLIGVGADSGETNLSLMVNDSAGTAVKTSLGALFPQSLTTDAYELTLFAHTAAADVYWRLERLGTGDVASGYVGTEIPAATQLLSPQFWRNNGTTALAVGIDVCGLTMETQI